MNDNSFKIKGWTVTVVSAILAFAIDKNKPNLIWVTFVPTILFWLLDGFFLCTDKKYRDLYDEVKVKKDDEIDFNMKTSTFKTFDNKHNEALFSPTFKMFYGGIVLIIFLIEVIIRIKFC